MHLSHLSVYWLLATASAGASKGLVPSFESFKDRETLVVSNFWTDVSERGNSILPQTTSIFIQRDRAMLFISKVTAGSWFRFGKKKSDVTMVEVRLGDGPRQLEVVNFPLITFSAELSSSGALIEREVTKGYGVTLSFELQFSTSLIQTGFTTGLGSGYQLATSLSQSMVCRANPGGRAQLQASTKMVFYPHAITRNVTHKASGEFVNGKWENVTSTVLGEKYNGALFYKSSYLGLHRCVTNPDYFEDALRRTWVEIS